jgi:glucose-1-phosphate adenylyltransferase
LDEEGDDFGHDLIPSAIRNNNRVFGYVFEGYWEDIGTIRRFYRVNLDMAAHDAPFDFYDAESPIYTHARFLPGSEVFNARLHNVLLADGCRIESASINDAVVGLRSIIGEEAKIKETVMMGADFLETDDQKLLNAKNGLPNIGIGAHSVISGAIIDKNARIGNDVTIRYKPDREDTDQGNWVSVDGIIVIPKNAIIPDGTVI